MSALLTVEGVRVEFRSRGWRGRSIEILHGIDLQLAQGETLGLVGESGSGKTTLGRAVLGLVPLSGGRVSIGDETLTPGVKRSRREAAALRQAIFQDPYSSLNPVLTIGDIVAEPLVVQGASRAEARQRAHSALRSVELPADALDRLPRQFSGGQRQRIAIARALALQPRLIVCDEPTSALDLATQARLLELLIDVQNRTGVSYLFISHDLSVVRHISHRVAVMHLGEVVEIGPTAKVAISPDHPYTQRLLLAAPVADPRRQRERRRKRASLASEELTSGT